MLLGHRLEWKHQAGTKGELVMVASPACPGLACKSFRCLAGFVLPPLARTRDHDSIAHLQDPPSNSDPTFDEHMGGTFSLERVPLSTTEYGQRINILIGLYCNVSDPNRP